MPEFHLDTGTREGAAAYAALDEFTQGYIEAMFFTSTGTGDDAENDLEHASFDEIAPETLERIKRDCEQFQANNADELQGAYETETGYNARRAGNDFWYTRNGHGTGFWDRGLSYFGDKLAALCRNDAVDLYRGDDGLLYL